LLLTFQAHKPQVRGLDCFSVTRGAHKREAHEPETDQIGRVGPERFGYMRRTGDQEVAGPAGDR
jgi:hypothetical protein